MGAMRMACVWEGCSCILRGVAGWGLIPVIGLLCLSYLIGGDEGLA